MEILGYIGAILMGLSLGLIGGGGSILTVPILVYLFMVEPVLATAYSLFIVGLTSLVGSLSHMRMGNIHWRTAIVLDAIATTTWLAWSRARGACMVALARRRPAAARS